MKISTAKFLARSISFYFHRYLLLVLVSKTSGPRPTFVEMANSTYWRRKDEQSVSLPGTLINPMKEPLSTHTWRTQSVLPWNLETFYIFRPCGELPTIITVANNAHICLGITKSHSLAHQKAFAAQ